MSEKVLGDSQGMDEFQVVACLPEGSATIAVRHKSSEGYHVLKMQPDSCVLIRISTPTGDKNWEMCDRFEIYHDIYHEIKPASSRGGLWKFKSSDGSIDYNWTNETYHIRPGEDGYLRAFSEDWSWQRHYGALLSIYADECGDSCQAFDPAKMVADDPLMANDDMHIMAEIIRLTRKCKTLGATLEQVADDIKHGLLERSPRFSRGEHSSLLESLIEEKGAIRRVALDLVDALTSIYRRLRPSDELCRNQFLYP